MIFRIIAIVGFVTLALAPVVAQVPELKSEDLVIRVKPAALTLAVGQKGKLAAEVVDVGGRPVEARVLFYSRSRRAVRVSGEGEVTARRPGSYEIVVRAIYKGARGPSQTVPVTVLHPKPTQVTFRGAPERIYTGTSVLVPADVIGESGAVREDLRPVIASTKPGIATIDEFGFVTGVSAGRTTIRARVGDLAADHAIEVIENPVAAIELGATATKVRTGEVVQFTPTLRDRNGKEVTGIPVQFTFTARPDDSLGQAATGQIDEDGRFVADDPGLYTIAASCGSAFASKNVRAEKRFKKQRKLKLVGRGSVHDAHTSDLWVWEGVDGRDYCVTGTWGANGEAHFWDVTNPADIKRIATVTVDARTVNDVKVSKDGRICILSREGASNRKNGIVIVDVVDPKNPKILSTYTEDLTGGVHNLFIDGDHVYALSAGRRYDVINIKDPTKPRKVGSYQVFEPGASVHDVWVADGLAYSSNWRYGIHIVDVGNGVAGGSPSNPKKVAEYAYPNGANHAAFPYKSSHTGKFYVIGGDEMFPYGLNTKDKPTYARGWMHFIDFTDPANPKEVARYQVPEAGTHNLWVKDDLLYAAYYNGGVRVVDISGDLMGDLYNQGREVAWFLPTDKEGFVPNAPMVWGPQPHKGHIFFSDWNTGLWAVKLEPEIRQ